MFRRRQLCCSFCGKNESEVSKLVAGPKVYICDQCVTLAKRFMEDTLQDDTLPQETELPAWHKLFTRIRKLLQGKQISKIVLQPTWHSSGRFRSYLAAELGVT